MTYSAGGLIQASDYNTFANNINAVVGTGSGDSGYGQSTVATVAAGNEVTAAQWSSLANAVQQARQHQSGAGTYLNTYSGGSTINATQNISGAISTATSSRMSFYTAGATTTGGNYTDLAINVANTTSAVADDATRTVTFASADQMRYFWNCGGQIRFQVVSATNTGGTSRGLSLCNLINVAFGSKTIRGQDCLSTTGNTTGYTVNTDSTTLGWYDLTGTYQTLSQITGSTYGAVYSAETFYLQARQNSATQLAFYAYMSSPAQSPAINDAVNITITYRIDIVYPETNFLSNSWGTGTVA